MVEKAGFDLVWFGIFIVLLVEIAELTPPLGFNIFVLQTMSGRDSNYVALRVAAVLLHDGAVHRADHRLPGARHLAAGLADRGGEALMAARAVVLDVGGVLAHNMWEPMLDDLAQRYGLDRDEMQASGLLLWETFAYVPETPANTWQRHGAALLAAIPADAQGAAHASSS